MSHKKYLYNVSKSLQGFDSIIVDTVSEILGMTSEVTDDRNIKLSFDYISEKSGSAILLVHHVNKDIIRNGNMDMASGVGLTSIMCSSKCIWNFNWIN